MNTSEKSEQLKEFIEDLTKEIEKIKSIDKLSEKVRYILNNLEEINDKQRDEFRDNLKDLKNKVQSLNSTLLDKIIDKVSEVNDEIDEISEKNAQKYIDDIVEGIKKLEKDYENAEDLFDEQRKKLLDDLEVINATLLEKLLMSSYNNTDKGIEYLDLIEKIIDYYGNLRENINIDEIFNKQKDVLLDELEELEDKSKDFINGTFVGQIVDNLKNLQDKVKKQLNGNELNDYFNNLVNNVDDFGDSIKNMTINNGIILKDIIEGLNKRINNYNLRELNNLEVMAQNSRRRVLFATLKKLRNLQQEGKITCKLDQTFTETDILRPEQININNYVLSNEEFNITI